MNPFDKYLGAEDKVQIAVIKYLNLQYPHALVHHSPNEGKRSKFEQYKAKAMNVSSGFPDLLIVYKGRSLALELKAGKNKATDNQKKWIDGLKRNGYCTAIATGFDEAKTAIDETFLSLKKIPY